MAVLNTFIGYIFVMRDGILKGEQKTMKHRNPR